VSSGDVHHDDMFDDDPVLAAFARDLERAGESTPPPAVGPALAAVLEGRAPIATYPEVTVPAERPARRPTRARLRWAVGSAAFGLGIGSLGVAGALPGPVQRQVSNLADHVGVHLPDGADDEPATPPAPTTSTTRPEPTTSIAPTTSVAPTTVVVVDPEDDSPGTSIVDDNSGHGNGNGNGNGHEDEAGDDDSSGHGNGGGNDDDQGDDGSHDDARDDDGHGGRGGGGDAVEDDHAGRRGGDEATPAP
jgi:hypothetical protein